jgi:MFS family permease
MPPEVHSGPIRGGPAHGEPARSQRISIIEGSLATVHITISTGVLVTAYALMLGADDFDLGLLAALTAISTVGAILGAQVVGAVGGRKSVSLLASVSGRVLWAVLCLIPFLPVGSEWKLALFLVTVVIGNSLVNLSGTAWLSWMTDLVPLEKRGWYFGIRNTVLGAVAMITTYATGWIFDAFVARGRKPQGFAWIFGTAAFFAATAGIALARQWEPPLVGERVRPLIETLRRPFGDRRFRRLLRFLILWSMATGVASPFFAAHMIKNLHMSFTKIAYYSIIAGVMNLVTQPLWGKVIDRVGNRPVLAFNLAGVVILPVLWLFTAPQRLWPIWTDATLTGLFWPGFTLASFNLILATAPERDRTAYLGMQTMAIGISAFVASLIGGLVAKRLAGFHVVVLGQTLVNFHVLFAASTVSRMLLLPLALGLREERAQSVSSLLDLVGDKVSQRFQEGLQSGVAIVKRIGGGQ